MSKSIHCFTGDWETRYLQQFLCGQQAIPPTPHAVLDEFRSMAKLETMRPLLCRECGEVLAASERQPS